MARLLSIILGWLLRHTLMFGLIIATLLLVHYLGGEWNKHHELQSFGDQIQQARQSIGPTIQELQDKAKRDFETTADDTVARQIAAVERKITDKKAEQQHLCDPLCALLTRQSATAALTQGPMLAAEIELLLQERDALLRLQTWVQAQNCQANLKQLQGHWRTVNKSLEATRNRIARLEAHHPILIRIAFTEPHQNHNFLKAQERQYLEINQTAANAYNALFAKCRQPGLRPSFPAGARAAAQQAAGSVLKGRDAAWREANAETVPAKVAVWFKSLQDNIGRELWKATVLLVSIILVPIGLKAAFFYVLAPLASRRPPIQLTLGTLPAPSLQGGHSAKSVWVAVSPQQELLVRADFLGSSPVDVQLGDCWLLDIRSPLISLACGLTALTRVHHPQGIRCEIAAQHAVPGSHTEIGVLALQTDSAIVLQPRYLIGVIQKRGQPVRISSHCRLTSLHAWLTLQFRYLVFHGPVRLLVQGGDGVKLVPAHDDLRLHQRRTIGFSANARYATVRGGAFGAYLRGQTDLLDDRFAGENAWYVAQDKPPGPARTDPVSRTLAAIVEVVMKAFGL